MKLPEVDVLPVEPSPSKLVSIILIFLNGEAFLQEAIEA